MFRILKRKKGSELRDFFYLVFLFIRTWPFMVSMMISWHRSVRSINITARRQLQCCVSAEINRLQLTDSVVLQVWDSLVRLSMKVHNICMDIDDSVTPNLSTASDDPVRYYTISQGNILFFINQTKWVKL